MSQHSICLNCNEKVYYSFCAHCGQKTDTHRITFKHLVYHDIIHGVWHIEKGILFSLKSALLRPGKAAIEYIEGKRIKYYNIFYLTLIFIGLTIVLEGKTAILDTVYGIESDYQDSKELNENIDLYLKIILTSLIPFLAIFGFVLFKKLKYNFSEHFVLAGMIFLGIIVLNFCFSAMALFKYTKSLDFIAEIVDTIFPILLMIYLFFGYHNAFAKSYTKIGFFWRIAVLILAIVGIMFSIAILFLI